MKIEKNVKELLDELGSKARIVAASKYADASQIKILYNSGITCMGENRVEALLEKKHQLTFPIEWHFIGTLQTRKVKQVINEITCLHSLDRLSLAAAIEKHRQKPLDCLVQVNVSGESTKQGIQPEELLPFLKSVEGYEKVNIIGLMTMAPHTDEAAVIRKTFAGLRVLRDQAAALGYPLRELSMGMSNDYQIAIEEGATMVRLGSVLFD